MIVCEGMDGTGKSTLIKKLNADTGLPIHPRAVEDQTGKPVSDLFEWAKNDVLNWPNKPMSLYDRHPFVSEYIYGPITRGGVALGFRTPQAKFLLNKFFQGAHIIFCVTDAQSIHENLRRTAQMDGVNENVQELYMAYVNFIQNYPGNFSVYNYSGDDPEWAYDSVLSKITEHINQKRSA